MAATLQGARSLAYWLLTNMPAVYARVYALSQSPGALSGLGCGCGCKGGMGSLGRNRLGSLGDDLDLDLTDIDTSIPIDTSSDDFSSVFSDPFDTDLSSFSLDTFDPSTLETPTVEVPPVSTPVTTSDAAAGDGTASGGSSVLSSVASALTSPTMLANLAKLGVAALTASAAASQAQTAQAVLQTQAARVAAGQNPAAISYAVNPATGQLTPIVATPTGGAVVATSGVLSSLGGSTVSSFVSQYGLLIGLAVLAVLAVRRT